jgi:hypothetical protein
MPTLPHLAPLIGEDANYMATHSASDPPSSAEVTPTKTRENAALDWDWMRANSRHYKGQWVALLRGELIDHDASLKALTDRLDAQTLDEDVLLAQIPVDS